MRRVTYPAWAGLHGYSDMRHLRELEASQWLSLDELRALQWQRLGSTLQWAYDHVPYYRDLWKQRGIHPRDVRTEADFRALPTLPRRVFQDDRSDLFPDAGSRPKMALDQTGGSTGEPRRFYKSLDSISMARAATVRANRWLGCDLGDKIVRIWGSLPDLMRARPSVKASLGDVWVRRQMVLNAYDLSEERMAAFVDQLNRYRPRLIIGYATGLYALARYVTDRNIDCYVPAYAVSTAETLDPEQKSYVEVSLRCRVMNRYASREVGQIASECPQSGALHVNVECVYLEIEPIPGSEDGYGRVLATDLINRAMPMVRYDLGDLAVPGDGRSCPCGRGLPLMGTVTGRVSELLVGEQGDLIHSGYFVVLIRTHRWLRQLRVIQPKPGRLEILLVTDDSPPEADLRALEAKFRARLGASTHIEWKRVDRIEPPVSGKRLDAISHAMSADALEAPGRTGSA